MFKKMVHPLLNVSLKQNEEHTENLPKLTTPTQTPTQILGLRMTTPTPTPHTQTPFLTPHTHKKGINLLII
jgi:hypothetical protein